MVRYFNVSEGTIQLTIAYNFLGFCIGGLFFGPLSECYGRRRIMIIASIFWLLISRFVQGIGVNTFVVVFGIAAGSYILFLQLPWIVWQLCKCCEAKRDRDAFSLKTIMKDYRKLLSTPKFVTLSLMSSLFSAAYMSFIICGPFLYMKTFGLSRTIYALHQGAIFWCFSLISLFAGKTLQKLRAIKCVISGPSVGAIGSLLLVIFSIIVPHSFYSVTLPMVIFSIGCAICQPVIFNASINVFPEIKGTASSTVSFIRAFIMAIFTGLKSYVYNGQAISVLVLVLSAIVLKLVFTAYVSD
ncbi:putative transporter RBE_0856 [Calliopsis andreniformis]|uniref:putative transporter RBE_0856 n=1 Tax=Calliopsis andreniformis TaxID=337506 RepID=UPI003FCC9832